MRPTEGCADVGCARVPRSYSTRRRLVAGVECDSRSTPHSASRLLRRSCIEGPQLGVDGCPAPHAPDLSVAFGVGDAPPSSSPRRRLWTRPRDILRAWAAQRARQVARSVPRSGSPRYVASFVRQSPSSAFCGSDQSGPALTRAPPAAQPGGGVLSGRRLPRRRGPYVGGIVRRPCPPWSWTWGGIHRSSGRLCRRPRGAPLPVSRGTTDRRPLRSRCRLSGAVCPGAPPTTDSLLVRLSCPVWPGGGWERTCASLTPVPGLRPPGLIGRVRDGRTEGPVLGTPSPRSGAPWVRGQGAVQTPGGPRVPPHGGSDRPSLRGPGGEVPTRGPSPRRGPSLRPETLAKLMTYL